MSYILLELHGGAEYAAIVTDQDGNNLVFENYAHAGTEASDCQHGLIVQI
jgi:hypothetical protein